MYSKVFACGKTYENMTTTDVIWSLGRHKSAFQNKHDQGTGRGGETNMLVRYWKPSLFWGEKGNRLGMSFKIPG